MKKKLREELEKLIELLIHPPKISDEERGLGHYKQGIGTLYGEASDTFSHIVYLLERDDKINHLKMKYPDHWMVKTLK